MLPVDVPFSVRINQSFMLGVQEAARQFDRLHKVDTLYACLVGKCPFKARSEETGGSLSPGRRLAVPR